MMESSTPIDLSNETDDELLQFLILYRIENKDVSDRAFNCFIKRYEDIIWRFCIKSCSGHPNYESLKSELYNDTIINIYNSNHFSIDKETNQDTVKKRICGWILKIVKNSFIRIITSNNKPFSDEELEAYTKMKENSNQKSSSVDNYSSKIVNQAFEQLSERDRDIIRTYWQFHEKGIGEQAKNLPPEILDSLITQHNTTKINIRQIISRGNQKIFDFLKANYSTKKR
jgi:DNA-directed RNA polymerase specialized sigma24 family protein